MRGSPLVSMCSVIVIIEWSLSVEICGLELPPLGGCMKFAVNGRPIGLQAVLHSSVLVFIFFAADGLCASEDDYLKALEAESEKIGGGGQTVDAAGGKEDKTTVRSQRVAFDTYLQTKHKGNGWSVGNSR